jgi:hypothetical protein
MGLNEKSSPTGSPPLVWLESLLVVPNWRAYTCLLLWRRSQSVTWLQLSQPEETASVFSGPAIHTLTPLWVSTGYEPAITATLKNLNQEINHTRSVFYLTNRRIPALFTLNLATKPTELYQKIFILPTNKSGHNGGPVTLTKAVV